MHRTGVRWIELHFFKLDPQPWQARKGKTMKRLFKFIEGKQMAGILILAATGIMAAAPPSFADEAFAVNVIKPVPGIISKGPSLPVGGNFGTLDEIGPDGVIIGDSYYKFASSVIFLSSSGKPASRMKAKIGNIVHFKANSKNEITMMWPESGIRP